jgi:hypothetical protein
MKTLRLKQHQIITARRRGTEFGSWRLLVNINLYFRSTSSMKIPAPTKFNPGTNTTNHIASTIYAYLFYSTNSIITSIFPKSPFYSPLFFFQHMVRRENSRVKKKARE